MEQRVIVYESVLLYNLHPTNYHDSISGYRMMIIVASVYHSDVYNAIIATLATRTPE